MDSPLGSGSDRAAGAGWHQASSILYGGGWGKASANFTAGPPDSGTGTTLIDHLEAARSALAELLADQGRALPKRDQLARRHLPR